jgi:hypothetical protein
MYPTYGATMNLQAIAREAGKEILDKLVTKAQKKKLTKAEVHQMVYLAYVLGEEYPIIQSEIHKASMERQTWGAEKLETPSDWKDW